MNCVLLRVRESAPGAPRRAVTFSLPAQRESNQRERAQHEFERPSSSDAGALARHVTRYGHEFRLHRGAPRLGDDTCRARPFGSVKSQALPDQSDFSASTENARAHRPKDSCSGSLSLVTFFLSQQKESDCLPGHPRRRLSQEKNPQRVAHARTQSRYACPSGANPERCEVQIISPRHSIARCWA